MRNCLKAMVLGIVLLVSTVVQAQSLNPIAGSAEALTPVAEVMEGGMMKLPAITWGGEYAMVYANGNSKTTTPDSIFGKMGLKFEIGLQDDFRKQLADYLSGRTPYLRGTLDMIKMVSEATEKDARVTPIVFVLLTRSTGGDAVVVGPDIKNIRDLSGKRIALQSYGPHLYYLWTLLQSERMSLKDVKLVWTQDLFNAKDTPAEAMKKGKADAAFTIIPDALALTSNGAVGTGAEGSVKGAKILLTTKTASNVIFDVYAVRTDYFETHRYEVQKLAQGIIKAQDELARVFADKDSNKTAYQNAVKAFARVILSSEAATADAEAMYTDCTAAGLTLNKKFFQDANFARGFTKVSDEIHQAFMEYGLLKKKVALAGVDWNYDTFMAEAGIIARPEAQTFNSAQVAAIVDQRVKQGTLADGQIFPMFSIFFKPNQVSFAGAYYENEYQRVIGDMTKLGGAVLVIEGHSDPMEYLRSKKEGKPAVVLSQIRQVAKNLSYQRALSVQQSIMEYAKSKGIALDPSQFTMVGHGFEQPKTGVCGADPCAAKSEQEWLSNMRVEFRIIQVEAEATAFKPL
ncbi:ABC transporter substrate-binding protein [Candidatus Falkowbacteria bacterium]|nr:ABC transporter substrate-binding protein [Candidatus Falkowbacteria bacterium]